LAAAVLMCGCSSTQENRSADSADVHRNQQDTTLVAAPLPAGVTLHKDKDIEGVWLAPGFNVTGYDAVYIDAVKFAAIERSNETEMRTMATGFLRDRLVEALEKTRLFRKVTTRVEDLQPNARSLALQNTIIEYEKGGGGARYFAGVFGGGQPVIRVRGFVLDGQKTVGAYEIRRSGESAGARMGGVFMSDEEIQRNDIVDLANDLAEFFKRTANKQ